MRQFDYLKLLKLSLPVSLYETIAKIHEYKGRQELYTLNYSDVLEKMVNIAKVQSAKSSNVIEGIYTSDSRLKKLINNKVEPQNKDEQEIAGYRNVIDIVHENYEHIDFTKNNILTLHNQLYSYSSAKFKANFKVIGNKIIELDALGNQKTRFEPVSVLKLKITLIKWLKHIMKRLEIISHH